MTASHIHHSRHKKCLPIVIVSLALWAGFLPGPARAQAPTEVSPTVVAEVQRLLAANGMYLGKLDGKIDSATLAAIGAYQKAAGMPVTGEIDAALLERLRAGVPLPQSAASPATQSQPPPGASEPTEAAAKSTALFRAASDGDISRIKALLAGGANVNAKDTDGWSALVFAAVWDRVAVAKTLLAANADVNAQTKDGMTALMVAAIRGNLEMAELLLSALADKALRNAQGDTAEQMAAEQGHLALAAKLSARLEPGIVFRDCPRCPELVVVPPGEVELGSLAQDMGPFAATGGTPRRVRMGSFALAKRAVTFTEWNACVADGGCTTQPADGSAERGSNASIRVIWEDARKYIAWLSRRTGKQYRLPSEVEWEYAACMGICATLDQGAQEEAGRANAFGLQDLVGGAWEWVEDCWNADHTGAPSDSSARTRGDCGRRVARGGRWNDIPAGARTAFQGQRIGVPADRRVEFRLARSLP